MAWTADGLPALDGRVAVVTGANSGIGFHTARQLAAHGARVILACRRPETGEAAAERIRRDTDGNATFAQLDLGSIASVRHFAARWEGPLDLLVNNAGVMAPPKLSSTSDGFELQFGTNHLGHFVLTGLLLTSLAAAKGRVVTVSSIAHHGGTERVLDGNVGEAYHPQHTYSNSKLANLLFALQLQREIAAHDLPVSSVAAHPGVASTGLVRSRQGMGARSLPRLFGPAFLRLTTQSAEAGARPILYAAVEAEPGSYTGPTGFHEIRGAVGPARLSRRAQDVELARRLWRVSEDLTGYRWTWDEAS